ncbi:hypothetical protein JCM3765_007327 [Sporobolomyces pararoseus]
MPVHIPDYNSASPTDAVLSSTTTTTSSPDASSFAAQPLVNHYVLPDVSPSYSSPLIDEKFIDPTSSQGIWIRIKGYTNHLSPVGKRYAREQFNLERVGIQADHYRETLLKDTSGSDTTGEARTTGLILKVEALKSGKVLAVVNSRLTKEEEEVYYTFVRGQEAGQHLETQAGGEDNDESPANEEELYDQLSRTTRQPSSSRRMRYPLPTREDYLEAADPHRWSSAQYSRPGATGSDWPHRNHEEEDEEEDYADLPPLVESDWVPPNLATAAGPPGRASEEEMTAEGEERVEGRSSREEHVWRIASTQELIEESSASRSDSTSTSERESLVAKGPEVDLFSQIMALNARHGHPSVQKSKTSKRSTYSSSSSKVESIPSGPPPAHDTFEAIMRINAQHGHPSVQAS